MASTCCTRARPCGKSWSSSDGGVVNDNANPAAWLDQANAMFKAWADQQQAALRAWTTQASTAAATPNASVPPPSLESMFGAAQTMWADSLQRWTSIAQQALPAGGVDRMLKAMFDPLQWPDLASSPLDRAIEHLVDGPSYATLWTLDRKLLKAQKLRLEWSRDLAAYQLVLHSAWSEALQRFFAEIKREGEPIKTWRELIDVWIDVANATLVEAHRTPEFLEAQRRLTRSSTECRLQEREIAEGWCEMHHIPTRTEIDDLARTVHELRRELRALSRQRELPAGAPEATASSQRKRKSATRKRPATQPPSGKTR
jgi:polyhydroxyalkanoate synthase subunit PhaE